MQFWIGYFLTAVIGTVVVYHTAPLLQARLGGGARPAAVARPAPAESSLLPPIVVEPEAGPVVVRPAAAAPAVPATPRTIATAVPPAVAVATASAPAVVLPPAPAHAAGWGLTLTRATYYSASGERRGTLSGGSLVDIESRCDSSRGEMVRGQVERDGGMIGPYLVASVDLAQFDVPRAQVPAPNIATLKSYYDLKGRLEQRVAEVKRNVVDVNPHAAVYREAVRAYTEFGNREKDLIVKRDRASGAERMHYVDQLRAMIPEGAKLRRAHDDAKAKYNAWKDAHPSEAVPDAAQDEQVQALKRQIAALEPKVREIVQ